MSNLTSKAWWAAAGTRAIKTAAQAAVACIETTLEEHGRRIAAIEGRREMKGTWKERA